MRFCIAGSDLELDDSKIVRLTICAAGSFWLKRWSEKNTEVGGNPDIGKYIGIYFVFGIGAAGLTAIQTLILWIFCSIEVCYMMREKSEPRLTQCLTRHLESCTREWPPPSFAHRCPFSTLHLLGEF